MFSTILVYFIATLGDIEITIISKCAFILKVQLESQNAITWRVLITLGCSACPFSLQFFASLSPSVPQSLAVPGLYEFSCPGHFIQMNPTISDLLCLALLSTNVFRVPLYCSVDQYVIPFRCWILFHCMDVPLLFIHSSVAGQLGCCYLLLWWLMQLCIFVYEFCLDIHFLFSSVYT